MPEIRPFRALRYSATRVPPGLVLVPPATRIPKARREALARLHPFNAIRLLFPEESGSAAEIAGRLDAWQRDGILVRDEDPACYCLAQSFRRTGAPAVRRLALFAMCRLEDLSSGPVWSCQRTLPAFLEEAVKRFQHTNAALQPVVLGLDADHQRFGRLLEQAAEGETIMEVLQDDMITRLCRVVDPAAIGAFCELLRPHPLTILSGHHEYEAALTYRDLIRLKGGNGDVPAAFALACIMLMQGDALELRPVYRLIRLERPLDWDAMVLALSKNFRLRPVSTALEFAERLPGSHSTFGIAGPDRLLLLQAVEGASRRDFPRPPIHEDLRAVGVSVLHSYLLGTILGLNDVAQQRLEHLAYTEDLPEALDSVRRGVADLMVVAGPPSIDELRRLRRTRAVLPPLAFSCHPPVPSGVVISRLDEGGER